MYGEAVARGPRPVRSRRPSALRPARIERIGAVEPRHRRELVVAMALQQPIEQAARLGGVPRPRRQLGGEQQRAGRARIGGVIAGEARQRLSRLLGAPPAELAPAEREQRGRRLGRARELVRERGVVLGRAVVAPAAVRGLAGHDQRGGAHPRLRRPEQALGGGLRLAELAAVHVHLGEA